MIELKVLVELKDGYDEDEKEARKIIDIISKSFENMDRFCVVRATRLTDKKVLFEQEKEVVEHYTEHDYMVG